MQERIHTFCNTAFNFSVKVLKCREYPNQMDVQRLAWHTAAFGVGAAAQSCGRPRTALHRYPASPKSSTLWRAQRKI